MNNTDLISRSALLGERPEYLNPDHDDIEKALFAKGWNACNGEYYSVINNAPTIDAVEVVRCRDCKHWGTGYCGETEHIKVCEFANYMVGENGYCVYGERKEDNNGKDN